ncbi:MAG: hypothetical protein ACQETI_02935 [Halobacteriota archaeon]
MHWEEKLLLGIICTVTGWMVYTSSEFSSTVATMPRVAGITVLALVGAVVLQQYVDITPADADGSSVTDRIDRMVDEEETDDPFGIAQTPRKYAVPFTDVLISYRYVVALLVVLYVALGYYIGLAIPTLVFLGLYIKVTKVEPKMAAGMFGLTLIILYVFSQWLETPIFEGELGTIVALATVIS